MSAQRQAPGPAHRSVTSVRGRLNPVHPLLPSAGPWRPARLRRAVQLLSVLLGFWLGLAGPLQAAEPAALQLTQAESAPSPAGPWQAVALPDHWTYRGLPRPGQAAYRARFDLPSVPGQTWALWSAQWPTHHRVWLNGALLVDRLSQPDQARPRLAPLLLALPPVMLQAGHNTLVLEMVGTNPSGLGRLQLGPMAELEHDWYMRRRLVLDLPRAMNLVAAGGCVLAMLLWWGRRSEAAMGWFGLLGLLMSLRNWLYFEQASTVPQPLVSALFFQVQVLSAWILARFAVALTGQAPRHYRGATGVTALAVGAIGMVSALGGEQRVDQVRVLAYPVLAAMALSALWLLWRRAHSLHRSELRRLLAALGVAIAAGIHDYLFHIGLMPLADERWLPFATPLMVLAFAVVMVRRVVTALGQLEALNQTLEQRVQQRTQALASANAAKGRFLAAASHDLRQPLVTIGLLVGLLREQLLLPAQRAVVTKVDEAVAAMESLLGGLLDLSRLDAATLRVKPERVALQPLFDAVAAHGAEAASRKGLALRVRPTPLAVRADAVLLEQVVRNLVANALRYTDHGGVLLAARRRADGQVLLQVWDTGRGIPVEQQDRVFEEFVQLDNPGRQRDLGLGLGLAIVQRCARLMAAPLQLRSVPGRGSCFGLRLLAADTTPPPPPEAVPPAAWLAGRLVLLVEDDPAVRDALVARLRAWGAVVQAHDGPRALRQALDGAAPDARQADLLLTDLRLAEGSGHDVVALARRRLGLSLPVLVLTGNTAPAELAQLAASGLPVLHKPFRADELHAAMQRVLAGPGSEGVNEPGVAEQTVPTRPI